jgi:3-deoxy-D-manno-octulosonic-acid transferase
MLGFFSHIFVQNGTSCSLLKKLNINHYTLSGDTRIDRVFNIAKNSVEFPEIAQFIKSAQVIVFGSTWKKDEELIIEFINSHNNLTGIKYIIAPHEIHKDRIEEFRKEIQIPSVTHSDLKKEKEQESLCLIIDSIGILSSVYKYGKISYIGGGFGKSIHNILEPAAFGLPVVFGPHYHKFNEATELLNSKGAFSVSSFSEFDIILMKLINDPSFYSASQQSVNLFIKNNTGAIDIIMNQIKKTNAF